MRFIHNIFFKEYATQSKHTRPSINPVTRITDLSLPRIAIVISLVHRS